MRDLGYTPQSKTIKCRLENRKIRRRKKKKNEKNPKKR
jgi:hypothetical protein